jgi:hypothetical protein
VTNQGALELGQFFQEEKDLFLCHNGANKPWVETLAEQLETVPYLNRRT